MSVTRRVTFRLYPTTAQKKQLFEWKRLHCYLYNACVEHRRTSYQKLGKSINYLDQQLAFARRGLPLDRVAVSGEGNSSTTS